MTLHRPRSSRARRPSQVAGEAVAATRNGRVEGARRVAAGHAARAARGRRSASRSRSRSGSGCSASSPISRWMLLRPFLPIFLWSVVLTVAFYPAFDWLRRRLGGRGWLAAVLVTAAGLAVVLGPTTVLISSLIHSLEALGPRFGSRPAHLPPPPQPHRRIPLVGAQTRRAPGRRRPRTSRPSSAATAGRCCRPGEWLLQAWPRLGGSVRGDPGARSCVSGFLWCPGRGWRAAVRTFAARVSPPHGADFVDLAGGDHPQRRARACSGSPSSRRC